MCRQIFTAQVIEGVGSAQELADLQTLADGHRMGREQVNDDFEAYEG